mgnify:CR=1 FL=1
MSMESELIRLRDGFVNGGFDYAYNLFPTDANAPELPFVTAYVSGGDGFLADDENYRDTMDVVLCLFTKVKAPSVEDSVRGVLHDLGLVYSWSESYVSDEQVYVVTYNFTMEV